MNDSNLKNSPPNKVEKVKFDLHMHTLDDPYDHHVYHTIFELIDKAASLQFKALAITLHMRQYYNPAAIEYAEQKGIFLIPGVEQNIEGVHVLLLNFPKAVADSVSTFKELADTRIKLHAEGAPENLVIAPHPFFPSEVALQEKFWTNSKMFDAIEVSGFFHKRWNPNLKAIDAAKKLGIPLVGNSDTHTLEQLGTTWSEVECEPNVISLIRAIKAGKAEVKGRALAVHEMGLIGWKVVAKGYMKWINFKRDRGSQHYIEA